MRILLAFLVVGALLAGGYVLQRQNATHRLAHTQPTAPTQPAAPSTAPPPGEPTQTPGQTPLQPDSPPALPAGGAAAEAQAAAEAAIAAADRAADDLPPPAAASDPALTLQGFDPVRVEALITGSALPEARKTALQQALQASAADPASLPSLLEQIRSELP